MTLIKNNEGSLQERILSLNDKKVGFYLLIYIFICIFAVEYKQTTNYILFINIIN